MTETRLSHRTENLIKMVNEIAANTPKKDTPEQTAEAIATHMKKFWAKPMKADIKAYVEEGGEDLSELAAEAVKRL